MNQPKTRKRPLADQGEKVLQTSYLDEMEKLGSARVNDGKRVPLSPKLKLQWSNQQPGYNYQWASDSETYPISLQQMCDSGYTFVRHENGGLKGQPVVQHSKACNLYLMRCENKYYEEDQKAKHAKSLAQYSQITEVGGREYGGNSKETGKGKVSELSFQETPDAISLMEG